MYGIIWDPMSGNGPENSLNVKPQKSIDRNTRSELELSKNSEDSRSCMLTSWPTIGHILWPKVVPMNGISASKFKDVIIKEWISRIPTRSHYHRHRPSTPVYFGNPHHTLQILWDRSVTHACISSLMQRERRAVPSVHEECVEQTLCNDLPRV